MKRILYIYVGNIEEKSGVTNKLKGLFSAFDEKGVQWTLFSVGGSTEKIDFSSKNYYLLPISYLKNQNEFYRELGKFIDDNPVFDLHFFRYPGSNAMLGKFLKKYPGKIIFEHNTKELPEVKDRAIFWVKKFRFRPTPNYFIFLFKQLQSIFNEFHYGKKNLRLALRGIAVTNEIAEYEISRYPDYECTVVSNGIDVKKIPYFKRTLSDNDVLNLIMLVNSNSPWHGVGLLIESFNLYKGGKIKLFLIGKFDEKINALAATNENILIAGFLLSEEYKDYFKKAHVGLGSFAMFRNKLEEGATLKVREYLASGLPVFLGHQDTDIQHSQILKKYAFNVDLRKKKIDWNKIYDWAVELYKGKGVNELIRQEAFKQIDFSSKADQLLQ